MKLYYEVKDTVYIASYDEIDEYVKNHFKGKDIPLHVSIPFKDICPYLKDNNGKYEVICDETASHDRMYIIIDDFGSDVLTKGHSLLISQCGIIYTIDDDEISGNYVEV